MKLAKDLAEKIDAWVDNAIFCEHDGLPALTEPTVEQLEELIAAKLEPVWDALQRAYNAESAKDMWEDVGTALAMLSEGE